MTTTNKCSTWQASASAKPPPSNRMTLHGIRLLTVGQSSRGGDGPTSLLLSIHTYIHTDSQTHKHNHRHYSSQLTKHSRLDASYVCLSHCFYTAARTTRATCNDLTVSSVLQCYKIAAKSHCGVTEYTILSYLYSRTPSTVQIHGAMQEHLRAT